MTRLLTDTSAYSAFRRGNADVVQALRTADRIFVSVISLGELRGGFAVGTRHAKNESELQSFLRAPRVEVLVLDSETSIYYAAIYAALRNAGTPIPVNDLWIAASAMQHGLPIITTDSDFLKVSQIIVQLIQ